MPVSIVNLLDISKKIYTYFFLQREVRKLLAEGKIPTYEKGEIVVKLMEHEKATEEEALIAATNCDNVETAKTYLRQECELCMNDIKIVEVKLFLPFFPLSHLLFRTKMS